MNCKKYDADTNIRKLTDHECILRSAVGKPGAEKDKDARNAA